MFGIGTYEMLIILAVGLMLFSPKELPGVLRGIARFWASIRRTADEFRDAIMQDEDLKEVRSALTDARADLLAAEQAAREELLRARMQVREAEAKLAAAARRTETAAAREKAATLHAQVARLADGGKAAEDPTTVPADDLEETPSEPSGPGTADGGVRGGVQPPEASKTVQRPPEGAASDGAAPAPAPTAPPSAQARHA